MQREPKRINPFTLTGDRTLPGNIYYGPAPATVKNSSHGYKKKSTHRQACWKGRALTLDADFYSVKMSKDVRRRRLPNVEQLLRQNSHMRSLPDIPAVNMNKESRYCHFNSNVDVTQKNKFNNFQYHGYESEGSEAETTIHFTIDRQNSGKDRENIHNKESVEDEQKIDNNGSTLQNKNNRKKCLSLDLKANYDTNSSNQVQSHDLPSFNKGFSKPSMQDLSHDAQKIRKPINSNVGRRYSDSLVVLKSSDDTILPTPDEIQDIFKMMSCSNKPKINSSSLTNLTPSAKKHTNVVSINEIPTFQEYRSPNSLSPQSSIDLSTKKPLPSIIKKARNRSYSLATSYHLDREFSYVANYLSVALSPPNPGSVHRALTPVASHLPLDEPLYVTHDASPECSPGETRRACTDDLPRNDSTSSTQQPHDKLSRRDSNCSNEYSGRENGRNNNQPLPLERRESRRGQFTRSLSNADVPPDEKAGQ